MSNILTILQYLIYTNHQSVAIFQDQSRESTTETQNVCLFKMLKYPY